jgi:hypothetical protein
MELGLWNHLPSYCHVLSKPDLFQSLIGMTGVAYHMLCSGRGLKPAGLADSKHLRKEQRYRSEWNHDKVDIVLLVGG